MRKVVRKLKEILMKILINIILLQSCFIIIGCNKSTIKDKAIVGKWLELKRDFFPSDTINYNEFKWNDTLNYNDQQLILLNDGHSITKLQGTETYKTKYSEKDGYLIFYNMDYFMIPTTTKYRILRLDKEYLIIQLVKDKDVLYLRRIK